MSDYTIGGAAGVVTTLACIYLPCWAAVPINAAIIFGGGFVVRWAAHT